jgi:hypothetical protein
MNKTIQILMYLLTLYRLKTVLSLMVQCVSFLQHVQSIMPRVTNRELAECFVNISMQYNHGGVVPLVVTTRSDCSDIAAHIPDCCSATTVLCLPDFPFHCLPITYNNPTVPLCYCLPPATIPTSIILTSYI